MCWPYGRSEIKPIHIQMIAVRVSWLLELRGEIEFACNAIRLHQTTFFLKNSSERSRAWLAAAGL